MANRAGIIDDVIKLITPEEGGKLCVRLGRLKDAFVWVCRVSVLVCYPALPFVLVSVVWPSVCTLAGARYCEGNRLVVPAALPPKPSLLPAQTPESGYTKLVQLSLP